MLGFGAIGVNPIGTGPRGGISTTVLVADVGALSIAGQAAKFAVFEAANQGALSLSAVNASTEVFEVAAGGALTFAGISAKFLLTAFPSPVALTIGSSATFTLYEAAQPGGLSLTPLGVTLTRTGFDYDFQQGGVGHYLYERERARQLAAITRNPPPPIDRRTAPQFAPLARPYSAPIAPAIDLQATQNQRIADQARAASATKRRRDEEAILLLAS